jgi:phage FluMu protein Com
VFVSAGGRLTIPTGDPMSIQFRCEGCGKTVKAPDSAAGRQGRCPACKHVMYIPLPPEQRKEIPIASEDEDERARTEQLREDQDFLDQLVQEQAAPPNGSPAPHGDPIETLVVGFVLASAQGQMERAERFAEQLARNGQQARETIDRMMLEQIPHDDLKDLPAPVINGYLKQLREKV